TSPGVAIWGSMSGVAMLQLKRAEAVMEIRAVELDLSRLLRCKDRDEEVSRVVRAVAESVKSGKDSIVASASSKEAVDEALTCGRESGLSAAEVGMEIASTLGEISARVAGERISGLILTGGAVAVRCLESMGVKAVKLIEEVSSGIPLGEAVGGRFEGLKIITKAGGFGDEDALVVCFEHVKRRWKGEK
ncbi:MAG: nucleotide-binding domain containing protein, partial [Candidatus Bathyarchaeia archaeon]